MKKYTIFKIIGAFALFIILGIGSGFAQLGKVHGRVLDKDGATAVGAKVLLKRDNAPLTGVVTKEDGKYEFALLDPGSYVIEVFDGERTAHYSVNIDPGESQPLLLEMALAYETDEDGNPVWSTRADGGIIRPADKEIFSLNPNNSTVITRKELSVMATTRGSIEDIAGATPGVAQPDHGDALNFRGGRSGGSVTFVDGMKIRGTSTMPLASINQMSVVTGGIPAEYGDVTGGIIIVTTYNPGMKGYFGPKNPNAARKQIRKEHKERMERGDEGLLIQRSGTFSLAGISEAEYL